MQWKLNEERNTTENSRLQLKIIMKKITCFSTVTKEFSMLSHNSNKYFLLFHSYSLEWEATETVAEKKS